MSQEIWKPVTLFAFREAYEVSSYGRVRRSAPGKGTYIGRVLGRRIDKRGYPHVYLFYKGNKQNIKIHRLVALAFLPNPNNFLEVNHKDGIKENNHISNLEWLTGLANSQHAARTGLQVSGSRNGTAKLTFEQVLAIRDNYIPRRRGHGSLCMSRQFGVSRSCIEDIIRGRSWRRDLAEYDAHHNNS